MTSEMLKGHLDAILLAVLGAEALHGYAIIEAIRTRSGGHFDLPEGTVYPALHRLEQAGLLASHWVQPDSGRKRRVYQLTDRGRGSLVERRDGWSRFAEGVERLLGAPA
ncbi:MAG: helix-turn-helix transcriptional regulator [Sphingopyxis sp.]|uniref:PadR family transcriptional regulator n=1 Tax=Sphingopyxis sp. TaxID=1908224 RepID=UPI002AB951A7|nr:helix-turn-helix transcriptional regulator [Sphingopyxis sp.]MDZ3832192.1 helix-turn-helix transcriptional regulator [Sphingopyxis sp.]